MGLIFILILFLSFILALYSMRDFQIPYEIKQLITSKKIKGTIIFLKEKIIHYRN